MNRVTVVRKNSLKRHHSKRRNSNQNLYLKTSQSNLTRRLSLKSARFSNVYVSRSGLLLNTVKPISNAKENNINNQEQKNQIVVLEKEEYNQSNSSRDFLYNNSIKNSTTCFDMSNIHRISPANCHDLFRNDFVLGADERNRKKKKYKLCLCKFGLSCVILLLLLGALIGVLVYAINRSKSSTSTETTALSTISTTTQNSVCTTGGIMCPTPMFSRNATGNCTNPSSLSYARYTCCYQAISTQLTIEFRLLEERSQWSIDDISMTQGNGELLINGGFESNFTGWIISSANLLISPLPDDSAGSAHTGSIYLYSHGTPTADSIKQTVHVIQGQNVNISFWWIDQGGSGSPPDKCEGIVTLTP